jgi:hypothetical protein
VARKSDSCGGWIGLTHREILVTVRPRRLYHTAARARFYVEITEPFPHRFQPLAHERIVPVPRIPPSRLAGEPRRVNRPLDVTRCSLVLRAYHSSHAPTEPALTAVRHPLSHCTLLMPRSPMVLATQGPIPPPPSTRHVWVPPHVHLRRATALHAPITVRARTCMRSRALVHQCATHILLVRPRPASELIRVPLTPHLNQS